MPKHPVLSVVKSYRGMVGIVTCLCLLTLIASFWYISARATYSVLRYDVTRAGATERRHVVRYVSRNWVSGGSHAATSTAPIPQTILQRVTPLVAVDRPSSPSPRAATTGGPWNATYPITVGRPYLMENPAICSSVRHLSALVIVHTAPDHFDRRDVMRRTWTNNTYFRHLGHIRILFLLGLVRDVNTQIRIVAEFARYSDILQGDFVDSYRNLTLKGVMGYKWIAERCRNARLIVKVDDDVIVDTYRLLRDYLPTLQQKEKQILCNHILPGTMPIIRDKKSKWFVRDTEFSGKQFYPRYCSGFFVIITSDVIPALYKSAAMTPFFWVDDVYLYGLLPSRVNGVTYTGLARGTFTLVQNEALRCYRNSTGTCNYLVTGAGKPSVVEEIWAYMTARYAKRYLAQPNVNVHSREQTTYRPTTDNTHTFDATDRRINEKMNRTSYNGRPYGHPYDGQ